MDNYLQGFIDGYNKAKESEAMKVKSDARRVAKLTYKYVTELQEKENRIKEKL